jgi:Mitochondrial ribosomal protein subunit
MATARLSPAASLLRNSRLFSVPPPLSPPGSLASESATQPHPLHAAIETPYNSWERGDWGFKRSLPLKSTIKAGITTIRVQKGIDSIEHITDFESAGDHVLTLQKWKELNLPIRFIKKAARDESTSVFEPSLDNVSLPDSSTQRRWRYKGPWLAGQTGWEFDALLRRVRDRKPEFQRFIRARLSAERSASRRQEAIGAGADLEPGESVSVTDEEVDEYMRYLRATPSSFGPLIAEFLDLPEGPKSTATATPSLENFTYGRTTVAAEAYREMGPPKTHPSAGISYYRSGAHVYNHPVFGPQESNPPVVARVIRPSIRRKAATLGIAGFVAGGSSSSKLQPPNTDAWQPTPGGPTMVVRPTVAVIGSDGRVILNAEKPQQDSKRVYGLAQESKPRERPDLARTDTPRLMPRLDEKPRKKSSKEADQLKAALDQTLRSNEDRAGV